MVMSAFAVAIGCKADMAFCGAHVALSYLLGRATGLNFVVAGYDLLTIKTL